MKTVDFKLTHMGDAVILSDVAWKRIEKFLKAHGLKVTTKRRKP